jgi:hypothetical protein
MLSQPRAFELVSRYYPYFAEMASKIMVDYELSNFTPAALKHNILQFQDNTLAYLIISHKLNVKFSDEFKKNFIEKYLMAFLSAKEDKDLIMNMLW